jgi:hypothetical protein
VQKQTRSIVSIPAFIFRNLFDTINDPDTFDEEWTPKGLQRWTYDKPQKKFQGSCLAEIGSAENPDAPTFIGGVK